MEQVFRDFFSFGDKPDDFYYRVNIRGRRQYYSRKTRSKCSINSIPKEILPQIQERKVTTQSINLFQRKKLLLKQIKELEEKVKAIDEEIGSMDENQFKEEAEKQRRYESSRYSKFQEPSSTPEPTVCDQDDKTVAKDFLKSLEIHSKKDWRQWLKTNHPDKGGKDEELCKNVLKHGNTLWN